MQVEKYIATMKDCSFFSFAVLGMEPQARYKKGFLPKLHP